MSRSRVVLCLVSCAVLSLVLAACEDTYDEPTFIPIRYGHVEGFVQDLDTPNNDPVPNALVYNVVQNKQTVTSATGYYRIDNLLPGTVKLTAVSEDGTHAATDATIYPGQVTHADIFFGFGSVPNFEQLVVLSNADSPPTTLAIIYHPDGRKEATPFTPAAFNVESIRFNPSDFGEVVLAHNPNIADPQPRFREIYIFKQGGTPIQVTSNVQPEEGPDFSPDGTRIVYAADSDDNGDYEIWIMNRNGTGARMLVDDQYIDPITGTTSEWDNRDPAWSADGVSIAFATARTDLSAPANERDYEIVTTPEQGGPLLHLTNDLYNDRQPEWHPDSLHVVYTKQTNGHWQLYTTVDYPGATEVRLTLNLYEDRYPSISSDGAWLAWLSTGNYTGQNPDGSTELFVARFLAGDKISDFRQLSNSPSPAAQLFHSTFRPRDYE